MEVIVGGIQCGCTLVINAKGTARAEVRAVVEGGGGSFAEGFLQVKHCTLVVAELVVSVSQVGPSEVVAGVVLRGHGIEAACQALGIEKTFVVELAAEAFGDEVAQCAQFDFGVAFGGVFINQFAEALQLLFQFLGGGFGAGEGFGVFQFTVQGVGGDLPDGAAHCVLFFHAPFSVGDGVEDVIVIVAQFVLYRLVAQGSVADEQAVAVEVACLVPLRVIDFVGCTAFHLGEVVHEGRVLHGGKRVGRGFFHTDSPDVGNILFRTGSIEEENGE